eukprot:TRINITY_DN754_c0_g1_i1.p1 TRINITY_DN754_c0_g1~~TRINITY_DN754_c0_g1_i1.p1  ORF type:complete len:399 (+),score=64.82 TRINITY_DN754_c0_g1_i1:46-1242(+)
MKSKMVNFSTRVAMLSVVIGALFCFVHNESVDGIDTMEKALLDLYEKPLYDLLLQSESKRAELMTYIRQEKIVVDAVFPKLMRLYLSPTQTKHIESALGINARQVGLSELWPGIAESLNKTARSMPTKKKDDLPPTHEYHDYLELTSFLQSIQNRYPTITKLHTAGKSIQSREIWYLEISNKPGVLEKEPYFKYVGNMHGDETIGREVLVHLIYTICDGYSKGDSRFVRLVNDAHIFIMPSMNPDGFELRRRSNAQGVDLNRNFPDQYTGYPTSIQRETFHIMEWSKQYPFSLSANMHGGALVANYPYDGNSDGRNVYAASPDDKTFIWLATTYAKAHRTMYASTEFEGGIINGAEWYVLVSSACMFSSSSYFIQITFNQRSVNNCIKMLLFFISFES